MSLSSRLRARERELGRPVRIGLAGAGQMGMGFVAQVQRIPGMTTAAIADVLPGRPKDAFAQAGVNGVVEGDDPGTLGQYTEEQLAHPASRVTPYTPPLRPTSSPKTIASG